MHAPVRLLFRFPTCASDPRNWVASFPSLPSSKSMMHDFSVDIVWYLLDDADRDALHQVRVKLGERPQDLVRTAATRQFQLLRQRGWKNQSTYLGDERICDRIIVNCATMQTMFRCGPYANKKSHSLSTSGNGGVQAHSVSTDGKA